ncbi:MAG: alpha/beta hydrolase [Merismopedia sp. SIO2A8]|nr:alpha/beta hydrolase [Merismopedia sp. SIO2A8]
MGNSMETQKPLLVVLPGMDGTGRLFESQKSDLAPVFDICCVSIPLDDQSSWDTLVAQVVTLVQTACQGDPERMVYLCGESFGACWALYVAVRSPEVCDRLILINSASCFPKLWWLHAGIPILPWMSVPIYRKSTWGLLPFLADLQQVPVPSRNALVEAMQAVTPKSVAWRLALMKQFDITPDALSQLHQQTLVIASAKDNILPSIAEARWLTAYLPNAQQVVLSNSGHTCLLEQDINLFHILQSHGLI